MVRLLHHAREHELRRLRGPAGRERAPLVAPGDDEDKREHDDVAQRGLGLHRVVDLQRGLRGRGVLLRVGPGRGAGGAQVRRAREGVRQRRGVVGRRRGRVCVRHWGAVDREQGLFGRWDACGGCHASPACGFAVEYPAVRYPLVRVDFRGERVRVVSIASPPHRQQDIQTLQKNAVDIPG